MRKIQNTLNTSIILLLNLLSIPQHCKHFYFMRLFFSLLSCGKVRSSHGDTNHNGVILNFKALMLLVWNRKDCHQQKVTLKFYWKRSYLCHMIQLYVTLDFITVTRPWHELFQRNLSFSISSQEELFDVPTKERIFRYF